VDESRATNLCHLKRTLPAGGELVCAFTGKYAPEYLIVHLELPTIHEPLVIVLERLMVPCILESCLPSSFIDKVNIITPELVLRSFIVCLNTRGGYSDFWGGGDNSFIPIHQKERCISRGLA
jgi:hypothetical protein